MVTIEQDISNTRHHLGWFTRRINVVSRSSYMVDLTLWIWHAVTTTDLFHQLQNTVAYIFKRTLSPKQPSYPIFF